MTFDLTPLLESLPKVGNRRLLAERQWLTVGQPTSHLLLMGSDEEPELTLYGTKEPPRVCWQWCMKLADGVYVRHHGTEENLEAAAQAALVFKAVETRLEYLGQSIVWYSVQPDRWTTMLDGHAAFVVELDEKDAAGEPRTKRFRWQRQYPPAKALLELLNSSGCGGTAATLELAMCACITAPEQLLAACGRLTCRVVGPSPEAQPRTKRAKRAS